MKNNRTATILIVIYFILAALAALDQVSDVRTTTYEEFYSRYECIQFETPRTDFGFCFAEAI